MTANRWWVRKAARWLARFKTTEGQLRSLSLAVTAFSTFSLVLQNAGFGEYVPVVGLCAVGGWITYSYLYAEGGVHNQTQRDMADLADNYTAPTMFLEKNIQGQQLAYVLAQTTDMDLDEAQAQLQELTYEEWDAWRDGLSEDKLQ